MRGLFSCALSAPLKAEETAAQGRTTLYKEQLPMSEQETTCATPAATYMFKPFLPKHPRLRFIEGAPDVDPTPDSDPAPDPEPAEDPNAGDPDALGDPGKRALDAMKAERNAAKADARATKAELDRIKQELALKDKPAEEQALEQARAEARAEATSAANKRILKSDLRAAATGKLADPTDAALYINLDDFEVDDNGDTDSDALNDAIADLLTRKPHLAAGKPNPFAGGGDGGARREPKPDESIDDLIAAAQKARNFPLVATLRQKKFDAEQAKKG